MRTSTRAAGRTIWVSVRAMLLFTAVLGIGYTLVITGIGQLALPAQANGSIAVDREGRPVGSVLIGQPFSDAEGAPLPQYFQPRPSAAGDGYDGAASSGSNLGPENTDLTAAIAERRADLAAFNDVAPAAVPADAVTASASGLDPDISPAYAEIQIQRVARTRDLPIETVRRLVREHTAPRTLGYLGEPTVNVLRLNLALDGSKG